MRGGQEVCIFHPDRLCKLMFPSRSSFSFRNLVKGAVAGFVATVPMSLSMLIGWTLLPRHEKYHLPPRLITEEITERLGIEDQASEGQLIAATVASHFGYGAFFGSVYASFDENLPIASSIKGVLFGLAVWMGSYLGWLPAMDILPSATKHPLRRNLVMILAHVVWGASLGKLLQRLDSRD